MARVNHRSLNGMQGLGGGLDRRFRDTGAEVGFGEGLLRPGIELGVVRENLEAVGLGHVRQGDHGPEAHMRTAGEGCRSRSLRMGSQMADGSTLFAVQVLLL